MNQSTHQKLARRKRRIERRLAARCRHDSSRPVLAARNIRYEVADRAQAVGCGGIGAIHLLARHIGLIDAIDAEVRVLKRHLPYHESDHVLSLAYNILAGGTCIEDLELRRTDEVFLDAMGAQRIPDPTTAGDFCRRFETETQVLTLMEAIHQTRLKVWKQQEPAFFTQAIVDADGTIAPTTGECKEGMNLSYDGQWGYHPLLISLANTKEPLYLLNRSANRPSHERARPDNVKERVVREKGFKNFVLQWEDVAEFGHRPDKCEKAYRIIVLRKRISVEAGREKLFEEYRYFFYITNDRLGTPEQVVFLANDRCDQENLIAQMKNGVRAMRNPLDNLYSNWAYMICASLAWTLKSWCGLLLPIAPGRYEGRHREQKRKLVRMEFKGFLNALMRLPVKC